MSNSSGAVIFFLIICVVAILSYFRKPKRLPQYGIESYTMLDEKVKSNAERLIADYFTKNDIQYQYEYEIRGIGSSDFYLPEYDVVVEYWGLVDADNEQVKARYVRYMRRKMAKYYSRNIKFVSIYPSNLSNLDSIFRSKLRKVIAQNHN
jgi:hypothetical protein